MKGCKHDYTMMQDECDCPSPPALCETHRWEVGKDACVRCGQSWRELYGVVLFEVHGDGSVEFAVVSR